MHQLAMNFELASLCGGKSSLHICTLGYENDTFAVLAMMLPLHQGVVLSWDRDMKGPQATPPLGIQYRSLIGRHWNRNVLLITLLWPFAWLVVFLLICSWVPLYRFIRRTIQLGHLTAALLLMCNTTKYSTIYLLPYFATPMCSVVGKSLFF